MMKNKEVVTKDIEKELQQEEVNAYAGCNTVLRIHCFYDCFGTDNCWITCAQ